MPQMLSSKHLESATAGTEMTDALIGVKQESSHTVLASDLFCERCPFKKKKKAYIFQSLYKNVTKSLIFKHFLTSSLKLARESCCDS